MNEFVLALVILAVLMVILLLGTPVAFALGATAVLFLFLFEGIFALEMVGEMLYASMNKFTLLSIPMFILMGAAIASSRAGADLYEALHRWLYKVPGGLLVSNIGACGLFSALNGSSPATCAGIGKMGIPELRRRGYPEGLTCGAIGAGSTLGILIPPSVTMIIYGVSTELSIGRLFLAGVFPGLLLIFMFSCWAVFMAWRDGALRSMDSGTHYSWTERLSMVPKLLPFFAVIVFIMWALYGGVATPSEAAGVGAVFCVLLVIAIYKVWQPQALWRILRTTTKESVMIMMIIGCAGLFGFMLSQLYVTQAIATSVGALDVNPWVLMGLINVFLLIAGLFLPPVAVIPMTAPILLPIVVEAGFDPIWFGVIMTINLEIGLITPPVGLNLYVLKGIAPDVKLSKILWGSLPFMLLMLLSIVILCFFPWIATGLPDMLMGPM